MQIIFFIKRVVSDQKLIMKCIVCGTRMHYQNFSKVLKDENFLGWKNKKKTVTTENIKKHEIGIVRSYFGTTESHQSRQSHQSR